MAEDRTATGVRVAKRACSVSYASIVAARSPAGAGRAQISSRIAAETALRAVLG